MLFSKLIHPRPSLSFLTLGETIIARWNFKLISDINISEKSKYEDCCGLFLLWWCFCSSLAGGAVLNLTVTFACKNKEDEKKEGEKRKRKQTTDFVAVVY